MSRSKMPCRFLFSSKKWKLLYHYFRLLVIGYDWSIWITWQHSTANQIGHTWSHHKGLNNSLDWKQLTFKGYFSCWQNIQNINKTVACTIKSLSITTIKIIQKDSTVYNKNPALRVLVQSQYWVSLLLVTFWWKSFCCVLWHLQEGCIVRRCSIICLQLLG